VANEFLKAQRIVDAANLLLQREIVLPRLVTRFGATDFTGQLDDTLTRRVDARRVAKQRTMRSDTALQAEDLAQTKVDITLDTHVYDLLNIRDEELTLDIRDFAREVLAPQIRGVVEGLENVLAAAIEGATFVADAVSGPNPYDVAVDASIALNKQNVPRAGRVLLLGANLEGAFLKDDKLSKVNESGTSDALRDATITRVAGFTVVGSNAVDPDFGAAFHSSAFAMAAVSPVVPAGASHGAQSNSEGLALRYIRDYNPTNSTGPVDRSLVDSFVGASSVDEAAGEGSANYRGVLVSIGA
jgi:hypothetical protein